MCPTCTRPYPGGPARNCLPKARGGRYWSRFMAATDEYELEEIKREIVESRSLTIKTNNLVNALSADLKSIAKRQQSYERKIFFNSATAYVVTVAVMFFALKLAWDARVDAVRAETRDQRHKMQELQDELK